MKKIFTMAVLAASTLCGFAQNSVIYKAETLMGENKSAEALTLLQSSFDNPKTTKFNEIYNMAGRCAAQLFNPELMKAAQNQPLDTATFINRLGQMYDYYSKSYMAEHTPNEKGKMPKAKFDADNTRMLLGCQDYFFYAGVFLNQNGDKVGAREMFGKHLNLPNNPALAGVKDSLLQAKAESYATTAYYMTILSYEQKKWQEVLETVDGGFALPQQKRDLYLMKLQAIMEATHDTTAYVNCLKQAITDVEDNIGFMESLISVYYNNNDVAGAEATAADIIAKRPDSKSAWYMKGCVDLNLKRDYPAAREAFEKCLGYDANFLEANANMAYAYMNEVVTKRQDGVYKYAGKTTKVIGQKAVDQYNKEIAEIKGYYEKALPFMEKVRQLAPDRSKMWASALQQIYFNLGRKAEANQMDEIMSRSAHQ